MLTTESINIWHANCLTIEQSGAVLRFAFCYIIQRWKLQKNIYWSRLIKYGFCGHVYVVNILYLNKNPQAFGNKTAVLVEAFAGQLKRVMSGWVVYLLIECDECDGELFTLQSNRSWRAARAVTATDSASLVPQLHLNSSSVAGTAPNTSTSRFVAVLRFTQCNTTPQAQSSSPNPDRYAHIQHTYCRVYKTNTKGRMHERVVP